MFIEYIDNKINELKSEEIQLQSSDRKDEENLTKVKINICEICKTLYNVSKKEPNGQNANEFYLQKLEKLSSEWKNSYEKAQKYGDVEKSVIEELKLGILTEIKTKYRELF